MKRIYLLFTALLTISLLCACGAAAPDKTPEPAADNSAQTIVALEQEIADLQAKITELEKENDSFRSQNINTITDSTADPVQPQKPTEVALNTPFSVGEVMELTLLEAEWCDAVRPSNNSGSYSYYPDKNDETYFVLWGTITSNASDSFDLEWCSSASIQINEKYNFSARIEIEKDDGKGFSGSVKPLQTRKFVIYASVSDAVYSICENVRVDFEIPDNEAQLGYFYDEDNSNLKFTIRFDDISSSEMS